jgi:hypothetical protein
MNINLAIDDKLIEEASSFSQKKSTNDTIIVALKEYINNRKYIKHSTKLSWEDTYKEMLLDETDEWSEWENLDNNSKNSSCCNYK